MPIEQELPSLIGKCVSGDVSLAGLDRALDRYRREIAHHEDAVVRRLYGRVRTLKTEVDQGFRDEASARTELGRLVWQ